MEIYEVQRLNVLQELEYPCPVNGLLSLMLSLYFLGILLLTVTVHSQSEIDLSLVMVMA